jgi:hypothetical protein
MSSIENIVDCKDMMATREQLHASIDTLISSMWRHCRAEMNGKNKWVPYFPRSSEVDGVIASIDEADHKLASLESDAAEVATLMSGYSSIAEMARDKNATANAIQHAESSVRKAMQTAIAQGVSPEDLRESEIVKEAELRRDNLVAEKGSLAEDLTVRLQKTKAILERYPAGAQQ